MKDTKYRLVEVTKASGFTLWIIEKKVLWWWEYVDSYMSKEKAVDVLTALWNGAPVETRKVLFNP